ncbi:MAG: NAD(P)-dependent oxidoreductase [Alkalispirochaetaceae bacterium]
MSVRRLRGRFGSALILENPHETLDRELEAQGIEVERLPERATRDRDFVLQRLRDGGHDLLFKRSRFLVDQEVLEAAPQLAAVMLCCIGDDSVDKNACAREGVLVMNDPVSNGRSVAEMVIGEMICLARRIFVAHEAGREHLWTKESSGRYELQGRTISVIGLGNIGRQVARLAEAFGMRVAFYDQSSVAREVGRAFGWIECSSLEEAFRTGDVVTLHLSAEDSQGRRNERVIGLDHFRLLGADRGEQTPRVFVNAARGFLYDPDALRTALAEGVVRAAAIDVFPDEPGSRDDPWHNPYAELESVTTTPHIGAATEEAQPRIAQYMAGSAQLFNLRGTVRDTVFRPKLRIDLDAEPGQWALAVVHSDARGTKKAIADTIFEAGANYLDSNHHDFPRYGIAYDLSAIDRPLEESELDRLVEAATEISGDPTAIRSIRQFRVGKEGD